MHKTAILILAAGASSRLGQRKQLLPVNGKPLLEKVTRTALDAGGSPVVVVLGAFFEKIHQAVAHLPVTILKNEKWESGIGSTVACGADFLLKNYPETEAVLVLVCDQLYISSALLGQLYEKREQTGALIVACEYGGILGVPALFDKKLLPGLASLEGDKGAKPLMMQHLDVLERIPFPEGLADLDTPEDLKHLDNSY